MKKFKSFATVCVLVTVLLLCAVLAGCNEAGDNIVKVPTQEEYTYINPDETKADADAGMKIDGVLDEAVYDEKNWLYLSNDDGGNHVNIATTSHFGEKGMYFVFDVTETVPIYVNLDRAAYMNSCIELYLAPPYVQSVNDNSVFEIDLLPTGDLIFKKSNGKYGYENVGTTNDIMAYLGATTKGGEVNTTDCYGYVLELFIPWDFMQWLGIDSEAVQAGHTFINIAHITSNNLMGTNTDLDRYWYHYIQQLGVDFTNIRQYFRFDGNGVQGTTKLELEAGEHYSYKGNDVAFPGMVVPITIMPDDGYALTSVTVDGQEQIQKAAFNEDGSITLNVRCSTAGQKISAKAEAVSQGKKTLSGKIRLNGHTDAFISYVGPFGEKPVTIDENGYFEIKDLDAGYYELKIEKLGYPATTRGIYLNRDVYTELAISLPMFTVVAGNSWILDEASDGVLYKINGRGEIIGNQAYNDFTFETYVKYDPELAKLGTDDYHLQQRSGIRILFSNGKCWHIDLMNEGGKYLIQYASFSGENSLFNWKNVHSLTEEQIAKYTGAEGIKLTVVRVGNQVALCLEDKALFIEELEEEYKDLTAQLGFESWIANTETMRVPFSITDSATLPQAPKIYFYSANTWDVSKQDEGVVYKTGVAGVDTWLDSAIIGNDITTIARDLTPDANDYSMIYIFKFSNGEQFRVRLNHTDNDGKYRIQSMSGSTLFDAWKNHYTLTDAQAEKVKGEGIAYRVWINGTTAVVYLDGVEVCTYDLSKVVATGKPSGIEEATVSVHLRVDGVIGHTVAVPFELKQTDAPAVGPEIPDGPEDPADPIDPAKKVELNIGSFAGGSVTPNKTAYALGDTVTLKITPDAGYAQKLYINGKPLILDWKTNSYSFVATEKTYAITGSFEKSLNTKPSDGYRWDAANQAHGVLYTYYPDNNDSWWMDIQGEYASIAVNVKNLLPVADSYEGSPNGGGFRIVLRMHLDNGKNYAFSIWIDTNKQYAYNHFGASDSATGWGGAWCLPADKNAEATAALNGDGAIFKLERIDGNHFQITLGGTVLETYTIPDVTEANKVISVGVTQYGNRGSMVEMPFELTVPSEKPPVVEPPVVEPPVVEDPVEIKLPKLENGTVTLGKPAYAVGQTVELIISANAGYSQKLYLNGKPIMMDWKTKTYTFVATEKTYEITGSFEKSMDVVFSDANRWDAANQAHGVLNAYYPSNVDSWYADIKGDYQSISVNAKNFMTMAESAESATNSHGYSVVLRVTMDNGSIYSFRIFNKQQADGSGRYEYTRFGAGGSVTGWGGWTYVDTKDATAAQMLNGAGAEFKLERTDANTLTVSINGTVLDTYYMDGITANNKVVSMGVLHQGNSGKYAEVPFEVN